MYVSNICIDINLCRLVGTSESCLVLPLAQGRGNFFSGCSRFGPARNGIICVFLTVLEKIVTLGLEKEPTELQKPLSADHDRFREK